MDERLNLHVRGKDVDVTRLGGDDAGGDGGCEIERIAHGEYPFAYLEFIAIAEGECRQIVFIDFEKREVGGGVRADDGGGEGTFVVEYDLDFSRLVHHVVVGGDVAVGGNDYSTARSRCLLRWHLALLWLSEEKLEEWVVAKRIAEGIGLLFGYLNLDVNHGIDRLGCRIREVRRLRLRDESEGKCKDCD